MAGERVGVNRPEHPGVFEQPGETVHARVERRNVRLRRHVGLDVGHVTGHSRQSHHHAPRSVLEGGNPRPQPAHARAEVGDRRRQTLHLGFDSVQFRAHSFRHCSTPRPDRKGRPAYPSNDRGARFVPLKFRADPLNYASVAESAPRRYWWVNQNKTFRQEVGGGYLWAPKTTKNNRHIPAYDNMREVRPGDSIFSAHYRTPIAERHNSNTLRLARENNPLHTPLIDSPAPSL
jgi:hypothetical protein